MLESGEYFAIYSAPDNALVTGGVVQGTGRSSGSEFSSSDAIDFNFEGAGSTPANLRATATFQASLRGTVTADEHPSDAEDFTFTFNPLYNQTSSLAAIAGVYTGELDSEAGATYFSVTVDGAGAISATDNNGCLTTGTIKPQVSGNVYDLEMSFGSSPCALPDQIVSGSGFYDPIKNLLLFGLVDSSRSHGLAFSGVRETGFDSDGDGILDSADTDDDNDGIADVDGLCPLDPNLGCPDTVLAYGKEWLQPSLFKNLSWNEINAVCPADQTGNCNGTLAGHSITGWTWASATELHALFRFYGFETPSSELAGELKLKPGSLLVGKAAFDAWYLAAWIPTGVGCPFECIYAYSGYTRDSIDGGGSLELQGHIASVIFDFPAQNIYGSTQEEYLSPDFRSDSLGGWLYRTP